MEYVVDNKSELPDGYTVDAVKCPCCGTTDCHCDSEDQSQPVQMPRE